MDVKLLHYKCQIVANSAIEDFEHYIKNAIFDVDDKLIEIELKTMKQTIGRKMNSWFFDNNYSEKQFEFLKSVLKYYIKTATIAALDYANKYKKIK